MLYPQGKSPWYPLDRRPDEPQSHSGHSGEEKNYNTQKSSSLFPFLVYHYTPYLIIKVCVIHLSILFRQQPVSKIIK
jgi:hypothetical protein